MSTGSISLDTSRDAHAMMVSRFEAMSISERALAAQELSDMCTALAVAGIQAQHGNLTGNDLRWHLAFRRYGKALADDVYGAR